MQMLVNQGPVTGRDQAFPGPGEVFSWRATVPWLPPKSVNGTTLQQYSREASLA